MMYVRNKDFLVQLAISKKNDRLTLECWQMMELIINGVFKRLRYADVEEAKDGKQEARHDIHKYWRNFDAEKSNNPFSFFTTLITNGAGKSFRRLHPATLYKHEDGRMRYGKPHQFVSIDKFQNMI